jgi:uncharacterized protein (TIGR02598 family)
VEVTLALGVASFCLLAIFALIPTGLRSNQTSLEETAAINITRAIVTDLRNTPAPYPKADRSSPRFGITVPGTTLGTHTLFFSADGQAGNQDANAVTSQNPRYRATIVITPPTAATPPAPSALVKTATIVRVLISWPALADPTAGTPPSRYSGSYESISSLDRADMRYGN